METAERRRVRRALDELKPRLAAFIDDCLKRLGPPRPVSSAQVLQMDVHGLLGVLLDEWHSVFKPRLKKRAAAARAWIHELKDVRNRWAHEEVFSREEADRAVDTAHQLSGVIEAYGCLQKKGGAAEVKSRVTAPAAADGTGVPAKRLSKPPSGKARHWTGNDENARAHHGVVDLSESPLALHLRWKETREGKPTDVGWLELDLRGLLKGNYIRRETKSQVRLRFHHDPDGTVYIQVRLGEPRLAVGRV